MEMDHYKQAILIYRKRKAAQKLCEAYFYQLTEGCGNPNCDNIYCSSSTSFKLGDHDRNQLAVEAIKLARDKAPLCQADDRRRQAPRLSENSGTELLSISNPDYHGIQPNDSEASYVVRHSEMHCSDMNCNESGTPNNPEAECEQQHNDDANGPGDGVGYQTKAEAEDPQKKIEKELKERLKSLFHMIITFHPDAMSEIHKILQTSPDFLKQNLFFLTAKPFFRMKTSSSSRHECNCDWVYESFEWLKTEEITENCDVSSIMANIENGTCIHYSSRPKPGKTGLGRPASVQLVHAAAAVGFIPILGTLLSLYGDDQPLTHSNKLTPLDIAVLMNDDLSVKTIMTFLKSLRNYSRTVWLQSEHCESLNDLVKSVETKKSLGGNVHSNAVLYALVHKGGVGLRGALAIGGDVDSMDNDGSSLLQLAVRSADPCVVLDILYYNPSAVFTKKTGISILMDAMSQCHVI